MPDIYLIYAYIERERALFNNHPGWFAAHYQQHIDAIADVVSSAAHQPTKEPKT